MTAEKDQTSSWAAGVNTGIARPFLVGFIILAAFVGGFGYWAARAPLAGAAIAPGVIAASGQNLRVQHFEGGIIDAILVAEGDSVTKGQPLLRLDAAAAAATRNRERKNLIAFLARAERLETERDGRRSLSFSESLQQAAAEMEMTDTLREQLREFEKRRERLAADSALIDQNTAAAEQRIAGLEVQNKALRDQVDIVAEEIGAKEQLLERGLTRASEVNSLKRARADLEGRIGSNIASIAEVRTDIVEAAQRKDKLQTDLAEQAASELNDVRQRIDNTREQLQLAESVLKRIVLRAPADGTIVTVTKNTPGSVVRAGEDLFVILPTGGELVVEARVSPADKELVREGQEAKLIFSTLDRTTPEVPGKISYLSADQIIDPVSNEPYFPARLTITDALPEGLSREQIFPGLPVETYIQTGERTFLEYLVKPITDRFNRAFREE